MAIGIASWVATAFTAGAGSFLSASDAKSIALTRRRAASGCLSSHSVLATQSCCAQSICTSFIAATILPFSACSFDDQGDHTQIASTLLLPQVYTGCAKSTGARPLSM